MNKSDIVDLMVARLHQCQDDIRYQWQTPLATSTRHFILDGLLPPHIATAAYLGFSKDSGGPDVLEGSEVGKRVLQNARYYDPLLAAINAALQDARIISLLSHLTGMDDLEPDNPQAGGTLSMMFKGDALHPHIDSSHNAARDRYRRVSLLYYVSPDWSLESGGNLELWDERCSTPKTIVCAHNRFVVTETTASSWHSVSPVAVDAPRCCISNYYYSQNPARPHILLSPSLQESAGSDDASAAGSLGDPARHTIAKITRHVRSNHPSD